MQFQKAAALFLLLIALAGCRSRYIATTITNDTASPVSVVQVDYPSASFGTQSLAPGQTFSYRFKIQGSGPVKMTWLTADRKEMHVNGPTLSEGQEGQLAIHLRSNADPTFAFTSINGR